MRASAAVAALALILTGTISTAAEQRLATGAYPEGLLWEKSRLLFNEMGADTVSQISGGKKSVFWSEPGCGPTSIAAFSKTSYLVTCHLTKQIVELSNSGALLRRLPAANDKVSLQSPNASISDGEGGVFFSDSGIFHSNAPATGRVYHVSADGRLHLVLDNIKYANGVAFDSKSRTLFVSEHLGRRILAVVLDAKMNALSRKVFYDFATTLQTSAYTYTEAGPDGLALGDNFLVVAEYGSSRVHVIARSGHYLRTIRVPMAFVTTVVMGDGGELYIGGPHRNDVPPFEGIVVKLEKGEW